MKKKFIVFTLCFTLIFSSLNYKKTYADGGIVSLPILATVSALAVGTGIIINNNDDLYDIGRMFYDYIDRHNDLTWDTVKTVFSASVALQPSKLVSVESEFLDIVKDFFDDTFSSDSDIVYSSVHSLKGQKFTLSNVPREFLIDTNVKIVFNRIVVASHGTYLNYNVSTYNGSSWYSQLSGNITVGFTDDFSASDYIYLDIVKRFGDDVLVGRVHGKEWDGPNGIEFYGPLVKSILEYCSSPSIVFPYNGGYTWDNVESKKENESVALPVPGDLGSLVGQNKDTFWDNTDNLVGQGGLSLPVIDSPSIGVDSSVNTFPGVDSPDTDIPGVDSPSVPNEGIWATIKDFIIGLVVPSDSYWTDTWGGLYNNFTNSFPMVDMDGFNDLVTGEKKFPNIDVNIMGATGRVVNGDVINSIVDWLRPIIAGFMMLCLMLFNYRKIYKLIRNTEPFGGIAPGTSDFSTGISEYNKEPVVKAVDMAAEYRSWKERGGK